MFRTHYKPRTHHRDGYHPSANLATMLCSNGRDLVNATDAIIVLHDQPATTTKPIVDRYALLADPTTRDAYRAFVARKRAQKAA